MIIKNLVPSFKRFKGLLIKDRLLRPSLVGVSKKIIKKNQENKENKENLENK